MSDHYTVPKTQTRWLLASRPEKDFTPENFKKVREDIDTNIKDGEILVRSIYISLDPTQRNWVHENPPYTPRVELGDVMPAWGIGEIVDSKLEGYLKGELVVADVGFQEYVKLDCVGSKKIYSKVHNRPKFPLHVTLNAFGITGMTAYWGVLQMGEPKEGQTFLVSGAAGATGMAAGCFAKIKGMKVVGIAGGPEKCKYITEKLGFDAAIDYKSEKNLREAIKRECPNGVDVFYDNVGGEVLEAALDNINTRARVVVCGAVGSGYTENGSEKFSGPSNYLNIIFKEATIRGIFVLNHQDHESLSTAAKDIHEWMESGKFPVLPVHINKGIDSAVDGLIGLWQGKNLGKAFVEVQSPPPPYHD